MNENYIERYWRDATPADAIKEPPMVARFSNVKISRDDDVVCEDFLYGVVLDDSTKKYRLIWESKKSGWHYCQVLDTGEPVGKKVTQ